MLMAPEGGRVLHHLGGQDVARARPRPRVSASREAHTIHTWSRPRSSRRTSSHPRAGHGSVPPRAAGSAAQRGRPRGVDLEHRAHPSDAWLSESVLATAGRDVSRGQSRRSAQPRRRLHRRQGFTFTVLDPADGNVIGCVYLYPPESEGDVSVRSWVRADRSHLDQTLADAIATGSQPNGHGSSWSASVGDTRGETGARATSRAEFMASKPDQVG